jgi:hypothetical protein
MGVAAGAEHEATSMARVAGVEYDAKRITKLHPWVGSRRGARSCIHRRFSTFQQMNNIILSQQISISISVSQISVKRTGERPGGAGAMAIELSRGNLVIGSTMTFNAEAVVEIERNVSLEK